MDISFLRERDDRIAFSVSELNDYIKNLFESNRTLKSVTVKGEISNFTKHSSGHLYFTLKDSGGQIKAVMFRSSAIKLRFVPDTGMKVLVHGSVSVYPRDGGYQIYVSSIQPDGIGALYLAYEQLKEKLYKEGLFDKEHKLPIPKIPKRIGVITSPTGAAVRDVITVLGRRFPRAEIYIYPSLVQGDGAEANLIKAIDYFDKSRLADVVILGRGGGSIEDLWAFNGEALARRIYAATIPIISAVGHETDFTICDFVADHRAPTPSAAAELAVPDIRELLVFLDSYSDRAARALVGKLEVLKQRLTGVSEEKIKKLISDIILEEKQKVGDMRQIAEQFVNEYIKGAESALKLNAEKLVALNPLSVLKRGYSITELCGKPIQSVSELKSDSKINIKVSDGEIAAKVVSISKGDNNYGK